MEGDGEVLDRADKKRLAREKKKKAKAERLESQADSIPDYEKYNAKEKGKRETAQQRRRREQEEAHARAAEEKKKKHKQVQSLQEGKEKHSKPSPAISPFVAFKNQHPKWDQEKLKEEWGALNEEKRQHFKDLSKKDKERYKEEMAAWKENQEQRQAQSKGSKSRQQRGKR